MRLLHVRLPKVKPEVLRSLKEIGAKKPRVRALQLPWESNETGVEDLRRAMNASLLVFQDMFAFTKWQRKDVCAVWRKAEISKATKRRGQAHEKSQEWAPFAKNIGECRLMQYAKCNCKAQLAKRVRERTNN